MSKPQNSSGQAMSGKEKTMNNVNDCNSCRFLKLIDAGYGFAYPECKAVKKHHPVYGFSNSNCYEVRIGLDNCPKWELGGLKGFFKRLKIKFKKNTKKSIVEPKKYTCKTCMYNGGTFCTNPKGNCYDFEDAKLKWESR